MGHSFLLVTVALFAGQVEEAPYEVYDAPAAGQHYQAGKRGLGLRDRVRTWWSPAPDYSEYGSQPQTGVLGRIRGWLGGSEPAAIEYADPTVIGSTPGQFVDQVSTGEPPVNGHGIMQTSAEPPLGNKKNVKTPAIKQADFTITAAPVKNEIQQADFRPAAAPSKGIIQTKFINKVGHEDDYSWLTGQLVRSGNGWVIHYATPETQDVYKGHLIVLPVVDMSQANEGDLVCIQGRVVTVEQGTAYRPTAVFLIERK